MEGNIPKSGGMERSWEGGGRWKKGVFKGKSVEGGIGWEGRNLGQIWSPMQIAEEVKGVGRGQ